MAKDRPSHTPPAFYRQIYDNRPQKEGSASQGRKATSLVKDKKEKVKLESERKARKSVLERIVKEELLDEEMEVYDRSEKGPLSARKKSKEDIRMTIRPRRDSTSSLSAAVEMKAKKEENR